MPFRMMTNNQRSVCFVFLGSGFWVAVFYSILSHTHERRSGHCRPCKVLSFAAGYWLRWHLKVLYLFFRECFVCKTLKVFDVEREGLGALEEA